MIRLLGRLSPGECPQSEARTASCCQAEDLGSSTPQCAGRSEKFGSTWAYTSFLPRFSSL